MFIKNTKLAGRPKGRKDSFKRIRGVDKRIKSKEAYKAIKSYLALEKEYNKLKMFRDTLSKKSLKRKFINEQMRDRRYKQALLYELIAKNYLVNKLARELGVSRTMPYRRYRVAMRRKKNG